MKYLLTILALGIFANRCYASPSLKDQYDSAQHDSTRLRICLGLINFYQQKANYDSCLLYIKTGFQLENKLKSTKNYSSLYHSLGKCYLEEKQFEKAIPMLKKARYWAIRNKQIKQEANADYRLSVVYLDQALISPKKNNFIRAFRQIHYNLRFAKKHHLLDFEGGNYSNIANFYSIYGNESMAHIYTEKTINMLTKQNSKRYLDEIYINMLQFDLNLWHKDLEKAKVNLRNILQFKHKADIVHYYYLTLLNLIQAYLKFNYYNQAYDIALLLQKDSSTMYILENEEKLRFFSYFTSIYLQQGNYIQAKLSHQKAMTFADNKIPSLLKLRIWKNQEKLLEHDHRFQEALLLTQKIEAYDDSAHLNQTIFEVAAAQERFESETREDSLNQQIKLQQVKNQFKEQTIAQAKKIQALSYSIIIGLASVIALIIFQLQKIRKQSKQLASLNANQNRLFGIISHDLRSPVASLQSFLTMSNTKPSYKKIMQSFASLEMQMATVSHTLNNLLDWSIAQMDGLKPKIQEVNLQEALQHIVELMSPQIAYKSIMILDHLEQAYVMADENLVAVVLRNILSNAIKFNPDHGVIRLSSSNNERGFIVQIRDSGVGMSEPQISKLFLDFNSQRGTKGEKGSGLGLKLSRDLMHVQGGQLEIKSELGVGTCVSLIFPQQLASETPVTLSEATR